MKALLVVTDPEIEKAMQLCFGLYFSSVEVHSVAEGSSALQAIVSESRPQVIVLDLAPTDMDGFELLSRIRYVCDVPVIVVTSRGEEIERVRGIELGADDYIVKPFCHAELVARVKAVMRRAGSHERLPVAKEMQIGMGSRGITLGGREIDLTPTEHRLMCLLAGSQGKPVSQDELIEGIWGSEASNASGLLRVHMHRLRQKLGDALDNRHIIVTIPGRGYRLNLPA